MQNLFLALTQNVVPFPINYSHSGHSVHLSYKYKVRSCSFYLLHPIMLFTIELNMSVSSHNTFLLMITTDLAMLISYKNNGTFSGDQVCILFTSSWIEKFQM